MSSTDIDWTPHDKYSENTCNCRCGRVFRSHTKYVVKEGLVSRKPCPGCHKHDDLYRASSDPERMDIEVTEGRPPLATGTDFGDEQASISTSLDELWKEKKE